MAKASNPLIRRFRIAFVAICLLAAIIFTSSGCASRHAEPSRRFHLHGKIVSVNLGDGYAAVDHDTIPG